MKKNIPNIPIMSSDDERFMAFWGLIQWTQGVVFQSKRVIAAAEKLRNFNIGRDYFTPTNFEIHLEQHYFVIAAYKLIEHREWIKKFGLCTNIDFSEIDSFSKQDIKDLRNMREHVVEYFKGDGITKERWVIETPEYKADASSCIGTMIGGRLDYIKFANTAERLLADLVKEPIPYPPPPND